MKRLMIVEVVFLCLTVTGGYAIDWSGYLKTDNRILLNKTGEFSWQEYLLSLEATSTFENKSGFYTQIWLKKLGFSHIKTDLDLVSSLCISPINIDLREAYFDMYGFILNNVDMRIGKQRIAWGTADRFNPTDNLNPPDLEDIWDFGRHLSSLGVKSSIYVGDYTITSVYIPIFTPALLPFGEWSSMLMPSLILPPGVNLRSYSDSVMLPGRNIKENARLGFKIAKDLFGYDFSLSYVYGRDGIPILEKVTLLPAVNPGYVDVKAKLCYPRMNIIGWDMSGTIKNMGIWAEAALFFPEKVVMTTDLSAIGLGIQKTTILDNKSYLKYVVGADYRFANGIYINGQYLFGFLQERGRDNLKHYIMFSGEWENTGEHIKIAPLNGSIEINNIRDIANTYAVVLSPEITYCPFDGTEISVGVRWIEGKESTTFGKMRNNDEGFVRMQCWF